MLSTTDGWATGAGGTILHWNGVSWQLVTSPTTENLYGVTMTTANSGYAVGGEALNGDGTLIHWDGSQWRRSTIETSNTLTSVDMVNDNIGGWAVGHAGTIVRIPTEVTLQYELTVSVIGSGSTSVSSDWYNEGTTVSVDALPNAGWMLDHWELDSVDVGDADPRSVTMNTDHTLTAVFIQIPQHSLTITVTGSGSTTPSPGTTAYDEGSTVSVDAQPSAGWTLDHWELDGVNVGTVDPYSVTMNADHTLTAVFVAIPPTQHQLTTGVQGSGTTNPAPGSTSYTEGSTVSVDAQPDAGWMIDHWELDGVNVGDADPYSVTMDAAHTLTAVFVEIPATQYALTITPAVGSGTTSPIPGSYSHDEGASVTVEAQPDAGWLLDHWELDGVDVGDANPYSVTMDADHTVTAIFTGGEGLNYMLVTAVEGLGTLDLPPGSYEFSAGEEVTVTAIPEPGWTLDHWLLNDVETDAGLTLTVEMTANHSVVAVFTASAIDITDPTADAGSDQTVSVNAAVVFDAENSNDDVEIVTYAWDFGDETTGTGEVTTHTYTAPGTYVVTLTVGDAADNTDEDVLIVTVEEGALSFEWWMLAVAFILIAALAGTIYLARSR
jgi:hypothetical protein